MRCWDRQESAVRTIAAADCGFGYRTSRFKREPGRFVVLSVTFQLRLGDLGAPVAYAELARTLGVDPGERVALDRVRDAVLVLRGGKGMVLDAEDHDTWSAGSFFTNPVLAPEEAARLPEGAPRWEQPDGRVKTSAAWLIDNAGYGKGYGNDLVSLSTKHALALTNRGGHRGFSNELAHLIEAGSDMFVMPSRYEPCGLNQMYSLRYGTVPVVRATGGLADTVEDFDPATRRGTRFVFQRYEPADMLNALRRALTVYRQPHLWSTLRANGMAQDFSWRRSAEGYDRLYAELRDL